ncbi:hypothetical protein [Modicisalibacter coralii]|uniref:hypothetical protein n=1 Tax=Modicisalibacter coralii TaxID=2304602 RepID=UPI00100B773E|nr:hypothetical protein [Halomonas coralii]
MPALIFFTSLLALMSVVSVSLVRRWSRGTPRKASRAGQRKPRGAATNRRSAGDGKQRRGAAGASSAKKGKQAAKGAGRKAPRPRREWRWPRLPVPPALASCLPLGLLLTLVAGAGQLALYGLRRAPDIPPDDPRLASLDNALAAISLGAVVLLIMGLAGWLAARRAA